MELLDHVCCNSVLIFFFKEDFSFSSCGCVCALHLVVDELVSASFSQASLTPYQCMECAWLQSRRLCAHECSCPWWPEEGIRSPGGGVAGGYESPGVSDGNLTQVACKCAE